MKTPKRYHQGFTKPLRDFWRWLHLIWNDVEWPLVILLGISSLGLGVFGFSQYYSQVPNVHYSLLDLIYFSMQLFSVSSGNMDPSLKIPTTLQIARFSSPFVAGYTLFQALKEIFKEQSLLLNLLRMHNHYVIVGLGEKGFKLTRDLRKADRAVVVIEKNENNSHLHACQEIGVNVVIGDGQDSQVLLKAGIRRANYLLAVCEKDGINVDIAEKARLIVGTRNELTTFVHITDPYLWTLLKEREFTVSEEDAFRLELFSIYGNGARLLLRDTNLFKRSQKPHIMIVGLGNLAEYIIIHIAQQWALKRFETYEKISVSVVDPEVERKLVSLMQRFPLIEDTCNITLYPYQTDWPEFLKVRSQITGISHTFVCVDNTFLGLQTALALTNWIGNSRIIVRTMEDAGLAALLRESLSPGFENIKPFGLLDRTCQIELFDDGTHESLARVIHGHYLEHELRQGHEMEENPSLLPWEEISEELRQSNRHQADHIGIKLRALGYGIKPWQDRRALEFRFNDNEIEKMAQLEHERWVQEKEQQGWQFAQQRDNIKKLHPDLTSWNNLSETSKEKTRQAVRVIPQLLLQAGFQMYPVKNNPNHSKYNSRPVA